MQNINKLFLHQEIVLLALHNDKGTLVSGFSEYSVVGAILAELILENRITVDKKGKQLVSVVNANSTGDSIVDECLNNINSSKKRATVSTWIDQLARTKNLINRVIHQLCAREIIHVKEDKFLFFLKRKTFPEINSLPEKMMVERLRSAIFTDKDIVDPRTVVLISLADSIDLLEEVFSRKALKDRKRRIEKIINGEVIGENVKETIQSIIASQIVTATSAATITITSN